MMTIQRKVFLALTLSLLAGQAHCASRDGGGTVKPSGPTAEELAKQEEARKAKEEEARKAKEEEDKRKLEEERKAKEEEDKKKEEEAKKIDPNVIGRGGDTCSPTFTCKNGKEVKTGGKCGTQEQMEASFCPAAEDKKEDENNKKPTKPTKANVWVADEATPTKVSCSSNRGTIEVYTWQPITPENRNDVEKRVCKELLEKHPEAWVELKYAKGQGPQSWLPPYSYIHFRNGRPLNNNKIFNNQTLNQLFTYAKEIKVLENGFQNKLIQSKQIMI